MTHLTIPVTMRFGDLDAYGHVNNTSFLRLLEEARIQAFWASPEGDALAGAVAPPDERIAVLGGETGVRTLVASTAIEYYRPLPYHRDPVLIDLWITKVGGSSIGIGYAVRTAEAAEPYAAATTVLVAVDAESARPTRLSPELRGALEHYRGPDPLRRRHG